MWRVIIMVVLQNQNPAMTPMMHGAQIMDNRTEISEILCNERAREFKLELNDVYASMNPLYAYKCIYEGEMI